MALMSKAKLEIDGKTILITGVAGFIGSNLAIRILKEFSNVVLIGIDSITDYTSVRLKEWRLNRIDETALGNALNEWIFIREDIVNKEAVFDIFLKNKPSIVINLAAQAGVR